jgi:Fe-S cluster assembly ATP-binding protein
MLDIENLTVTVQGKKILKSVDMHVSSGETVALFGPNGSGKTSLLHTIMGFPGYTVETGTIQFKGEDITGMSIDKRAERGIGMAFQRPPAVRGVKLRDILRMCINRREDVDEAAIGRYVKKLNLDEFQDRDINLGFSGGEIKRCELVQLLAQNPDFTMFDEPDSGVDLVSIHLVGTVINELLQKDNGSCKKTKAGLIISHAGHILEYVNADRAYVILDGRLHCSGNPRDILDNIKSKGYEGCVTCLR